jgi:hypothetical protein
VNHLAVDQIVCGFEMGNFQGAHSLDGQSERLIGTAYRIQLSQALSRGPQDAEHLRPIESLAFTVIAEAHTVVLVSTGVLVVSCVPGDRQFHGCARGLRRHGCRARSF